MIAYDKKGVKILHGDCLPILREMPENSFDSIVTDPPAGIAFMSKDWDRNKGGRNQWIGWMTEIAIECLRVVKPGSHAVVWSIPRTSHWTGMAWEDAGWEVRDKVYHVFGQGFPKSLDVSKAIDRSDGVSSRGKEFKETLRRSVIKSGKSRKEIDDACGFTMRYDTPYEKDPVGWGCTFPGVEQWNVIKKVLNILDDWDCFVAGAERDVVGTERRTNSPSGIVSAGRISTKVDRNITVPSTDAAKQWNGWHTALKPSVEEWWLLRKPLIGIVAENVLKYGTGALNIDACRVPFENGGDLASNPSLRESVAGGNGGRVIATETDRRFYTPNQTGRFPANLIHDGSDEVLALFPHTESGKDCVRTKSGYWGAGDSIHGGLGKAGDEQVTYGDSGSAARFFYCAKASTADRGDENSHPTVKPQSLMRYLVKLVTPPGSVVLDPFLGSGTTALAARDCGFNVVGIERELEYITIAKGRLFQAQPMLDLTP